MKAAFSSLSTNNRPQPPPPQPRPYRSRNFSTGRPTELWRSRRPSCAQPTSSAPSKCIRTRVHPSIPLVLSGSRSRQIFAFARLLKSNFRNRKRRKETKKGIKTEKLNTYAAGTQVEVLHDRHHVWNRRIRNSVQKNIDKLH